MNFWFYIGIGLVLWIIYDLYMGEVWGFEKVSRKENPSEYWFWTFLWMLVAAGTLFFSLY